MKSILVAALILSAPSLLASQTYKGRITVALECSQIQDAGFFTSERERQLECHKIGLPSQRSCEVILENDAPKKATVKASGFLKRASTFKGGIAIYKSHERNGYYSKSRGLFGNRSAPKDQLEILLSRSNTRKDFSLEKIALYLDHENTSNGRVSWIEYECAF